MEPISFMPIYMERVWGGRELERVYQRGLPNASTPYGESWEIVDREEACSVVRDGPLMGKTLSELWHECRSEVFGSDYAALGGPFPILIKILDARDDLSIQVHPPLHLADSLGGEPKTEMWVIAAAEPDAKLYVGMKHGVSADDFRRAIADGTVADCVHAIEPKPGEFIFIPSGRLHAIGAGFLIHEIQQNSDTTYRVFDWNRMGLDGKPRELHVEDSLASINFDDFEPGMDEPEGILLAECPFFRTERILLLENERVDSGNPDRFAIIGLIEGMLDDAGGRRFKSGDYCLLPCGGEDLRASMPSTVLRITLPLAPHARRSQAGR